jgi:hypothetical protein
VPERVSTLATDDEVVDVWVVLERPVQRCIRSNIGNSTRGIRQHFCRTRKSTVMKKCFAPRDSSCRSYPGRVDFDRRWRDGEWHSVTHEHLGTPPKSSRHQNMLNEDLVPRANLLVRAPEPASPSSNTTRRMNELVPVEHFVLARTSWPSSKGELVSPSFVA